MYVKTRKCNNPEMASFSHWACYLIVRTYSPIEISMGFTSRPVCIRTSKKILNINPIDAL